MFHAHSGWYFGRADSGGVTIEKHDPTTDEVLVGVVVNASTWASIVASVCARGENRETYDEAFESHMRAPSETS